MKKLIIFILGPTCSGKTNLSIDLFNYFPIEVVNFDSSMFYKYMNIGTGKPSLFFTNRFKHHLIDVKEPNESYSVFDFCIDSILKIIDCWNNDKIPLFVGGTMMYAWFLQNILNFFLLNDFKFLSNLSVYGIREYFFKNFNFINIFLLPFEKYTFYCKIKERFLFMLKCGFLDEILYLYSRGDLTLNSQSIKSIGYKDFWLYLEGRVSFSNCVDSVIKSTIDLSVKQLKWAKKFQSNLFYVESKDKIVLKKCVYLINKYLY